MKIMLQGYLNNANFGDILAAKLFYGRCISGGFSAVDFYQYKDYGIGDFCRRQIGYSSEKNLFSCFCSDAFVIISGGSFWNDGANISDAKIRYRRFILPALIYQMLGKPVYVLGVGGGPVDTPWLRKKMVRLLNKAKRVTFRDDYTFEVFSEYGVTNEMSVTADTMLVIRDEMLDPFSEKDNLEKASRGRKKLLLHMPDGARKTSYVADLIMPALILFLNQHEEYYLVLSNDNIRSIGSKEANEVNRVRQMLADSGIEFYDYKYHDCWQMCSLINEMDCVVTSKLHVGVVGCALNKSVVSFPVHREKTDNFYRMIGESERCVNVRKLDSEKAYEQLCRFHNKPVHISDELRRKAEMNLSILDDISAGRG